MFTFLLSLHVAYCRLRPVRVCLWFALLLSLLVVAAEIPGGYRCRCRCHRVSHAMVCQSFGFDLVRCDNQSCVCHPCPFLTVFLHMKDRERQSFQEALPGADVEAALPQAALRRGGPSAQLQQGRYTTAALTVCGLCVFYLLLVSVCVLTAHVSCSKCVTLCKSMPPAGVGCGNARPFTIRGDTRRCNHG